MGLTKKIDALSLLREKRNSLLQETDFYALSDASMSSNMKTYRQQLRDLPASANPKVDSVGNLDMSSVTFPTKPN